MFFRMSRRLRLFRRRSIWRASLLQLTHLPRSILLIEILSLLTLYKYRLFFISKMILLQLWVGFQRGAGGEHVHAAFTLCINSPAKVYYVCFLHGIYNRHFVHGFLRYNTEADTLCIVHSSRTVCSQSTHCALDLLPTGDWLIDWLIDWFIDWLIDWQWSCIPSV